MIKTIEFGDKKVTFSTSFNWMIIFKNQFGEDAAKTIMPLIRAMQKPEYTENDYGYLVYETLGFTGIAEIAWALAKNADNSVPDPEAWMESLGDNYSASDVAVGLIPEVVESSFTSKKSMAPKNQKKQTTKKEPETKKSTQS